MFNNFLQQDGFETGGADEEYLKGISGVHLLSLETIFGGHEHRFA
ncbi:hypothetical protein Z947_3662 [Sulfitobacter geojensis]|nr:hypothetical protein Z947_3662 [Sulfitobacter geojensis]